MSFIERFFYCVVYSECPYRRFHCALNFSDFSNNCLFSPCAAGLADIRAQAMARKRRKQQQQQQEQANGKYSTSKEGGTTNGGYEGSGNTTSSDEEESEGGSTASEDGELTRGSDGRANETEDVCAKVEEDPAGSEVSKLNSPHGMQES